MIQIKKTDKVSMTFDRIAPGYDGHCLRAYQYWEHLMPDITEELNKVREPGKIYKVTLDTGEVKIFNENDPELKQYIR